jgi:diaminohydroxyphosphoribosylaminopyrimidine deaminase/5-amino-6-(5-phosphoribosylamino)uracil reductase
MKYNAQYLQRAILISQAGLGMTHPNPIVGAVIVSKEGLVLGEGFHIGGNHAEVLAIADARSNGHSLKGATLYSSLEPCNHHGRTPPCTEAIINSGIASVYFAISDPNPIASGGAARLREAGILVQGELLTEEAVFSNRAWLTKVTLGRPRVTVKIAQTIDGKVAAADGRSKWITSAASREHAKQLRDGFDAICIGAGTAIADNPTLRGATRNLKRFVIGARDLPPLNLDRDEGYEQIRTGNPNKVLSTLIEGGPTLSSSFLRSGLVDEIHLYMAGSIMGSGKSSVDIAEFNSFSHQLHYSVSALSVIESDIFVIYLKKESE